MATLSRYTLEDLSGETGLSTRTIRHYIGLGLLPGPEALGRNAWYSEEHLDRLKCIQVLRDATGSSLSDLRPVLNSLTGTQIRDIAAGREQVMALPVGVASPGGPKAWSGSAKSSRHREATTVKPTETREDSGSEMLDALSYIRSIRSGPNGDVSRFSGVVRGLQRVTGRGVPRRSRNEWWATVPITPDIEICARGLDDRDIGELERIADLIRYLLMKGGRE